MSLTTDDIEDIQQLIAANNHVLLAEFDKRMGEKLEQKLAPINQKIDDLTDFVREAIDTSNEVTGEQLADHEARIVKFEKATA